MIVLDDGWFGKRNDDHTSLGDWIPDLEKFPRGMKGIAEDVNAVGCKFGLWLEPEMVSIESVCLFFSVAYQVVSSFVLFYRLCFNRIQIGVSMFPIVLHRLVEIKWY